MDSLELIQSIDAAIRTIANARRQLAGGSFRLWQICSHAEDYLDKQIKELLAPAEETAAPAARGGILVSNEVFQAVLARDHAESVGQ